MESSQPHLALALVEHIGVGLLILDQDLRIQYWNGYVTRCSGKSLETGQGRAFIEAFPEADTPRLREMIDKARIGRHVYTQWREEPFLVRLPGTAPQNPLMLQSTLFFPFPVNDRTYYGLVLYDTADLARTSGKLEAALDALGHKQSEQEQLIRKLEQANNQLLQSEKLAAIGQ